MRALRKAVVIAGLLILGAACVEQTRDGQEAAKQVEAIPGVQPEAIPEAQIATIPEVREVEILAEDVYDAPVKTQVTQHILVSGDLTAEGLEIFLRERYAELMSRTGYTYHASPNSVYVYAYKSKDHFESGMGQWIAMIQQAASENQWKVSTNERQLHYLNTEPEERLGLTEDQRIQVFWESVRVEDRALAEAMAEHPGDWEKQIDRERELTEKYRREVAVEYGLTMEQLEEIEVEGTEKDWPMPPSELQ